MKIIDVLLANNVGTILMIAFTNHALDHMLCSVLDSGITKKIVRLGSRSSDERISQFSIEAMEAVVGKSRLDRAFSRNHGAVRMIEEQIKDLNIELEKVRNNIRLIDKEIGESSASMSNLRENLRIRRLRQDIAATQAEIDAIDLEEAAKAKRIFEEKYNIEKQMETQLQSSVWTVILLTGLFPNVSVVCAYRG